MDKVILGILMMAIFTGCASQTPYQKIKKGEGYYDSKVDDLRLSTFKANHYTKASTARLYAEFRAIYKCQKEGYKFANVIDIFDKSKRKNVTKTDATAIGPTYYGGYGMYPFYSRYPGAGVGIGFDYSNVSATTYEETYVYPYIEVPYTCANNIYRPKIMFREVPADKMKELVKDLKGAVQIQKILEGSPNSTLKADDIITHVNGQRIEQVYQIIKLFDEKTRSVNVTFLREGKKMQQKMKAIDVSDIAAPAEEKIIAEACKKESVYDLYKKKLCKGKFKPD